VVKWFKSIKDYFTKFKVKDPAAEVLAIREASDTPWASFEVFGFEADGRIAINFNWNQAFIQKVRSMGFEGETEEDTVQLFFYTSSMRPTSMASDPEDEAVQSLAHPSLSSIENEIKV
jgi:hypothetical protein